MNVLKSLLVTSLLLSNTGCMLLLGGGTYDMPVFVEGELVSPGQNDCSIRFLSARTGRTHSTQTIKPGPFKTSFVINPGDKVADFRAELACGGPWVAIGATDAFSHGQHVALGLLSP